MAKLSNTLVKSANLPPSLRRLFFREGRRPQLDFRYPCVQLENPSPPAIRAQLLTLAQTLEGVQVQQTELSVPGGMALVLSERMAKGQPEAFIRSREFAIVRQDGSVHLALPPAWGQKVFTKGWVTVHPLVRYLAGILPPQSLVLYAPRDEKELAVAWKVMQATYWFARGEVEGRPLPDSAW